ncbi:MAG: YbeD family protein [Acidithiobacillus sp.]
MKANNLEERPMEASDHPADDFPHTHHVKAIGQNSDLLAAVRQAVALHVPELPETAFSCRASREGKYLAVTCTLEAQSREQLEAIYQALRNVDGVILCL